MNLLRRIAWIIIKKSKYSVPLATKNSRKVQLQRKADEGLDAMPDF